MQHEPDPSDSLPELLIRGGTVVFDGKTLVSDILVDDGKIVSISALGQPLEAVRVLDAKGKIVMPGAVDPHVHFKEPGPGSIREDYYSGSCQAAAGGVTTVIEMPLSQPLVTNGETFDFKYQIANKKSVVDFALWGGLNTYADGHYHEMKDAGAVAYKVFLSTDPDSPRMGDYDLLNAMRDIAEFDGLVGVHAENADIIDRNVEAMQAAGRKDALAHLDSRPDIAEMEAIQRIALFAEETDCRLHICHLATAKARTIIQQARDRKVKLSVETCPHYLVMDSRDLERCGSFAKCNPPLRSAANRDGLWEMILAGEINMIGSDHCPYIDEDRLQHGDDIWGPPPGMAGIDLFLPLLIDEGIHKRGLQWPQLAELVASAPADRFAIAHRKGRIRIGNDADFAIIDPEAEWQWSWQTSFAKSKSKYTPLEGRSGKGKVVETIVRGKTVYRDQQIQVDAGYGEIIKP